MSSAPIELITGLPGNGKTLYALKYVKEWSERESRPVFYHGIQLGDELAGKWTPIDPEKWFDAPPGAIIVIDECQIIFRPRSLGKEPPPYVARLETIRHQGLNIVLITQHPLLVDSSIRRLCGKHMHCIRKWGTESSTIHEWPSVRDNCDKPAGRKDSIKHAWKFDKSIYALYKSAEIHTIKRNIPMRVWLLFALPVILIAMAYLVYWLMVGKKMKDQPPQPAQFTSSQPVQQSSPPQKEKWQDPLADAKRYMFDETPRVSGLQHTAPKYDGVTAPVTAPIPAACVKMRGECKCYSQQGTILAVELATCEQIVEKGFFVDFKQEQPQQQQSAYGQPYLVKADALRVPVDPARPEQVASAVGILNADNTTAGRKPEGVRSRDQDAKGMGYAASY
ncbi:zonular occludens toxin domain-containing protein [uncultured Oxalicibacterium sp.]|uniref:zonular occludens toxin domain-containing protein n=1 Tax=uncultured Oxalicibacterium sp. TaxID=1168540 RepID=UPI0025DF628F|nr:zonular occludens toxin domain-containing protein [uncultured Oxalicibacterium sp.]